MIVSSTPVQVDDKNVYSVNKFESIACQFGQYIVSATWENDNTINCVLYTKDYGGAVSLPFSTTMNGKDYHGKYDSSFDIIPFHFVDRPGIVNLHPSSG